MAEKLKREIYCIFLFLTLLAGSGIPVAAKETITTSVNWEYQQGPNQKILTAIAQRLGARTVVIHAPFKRRLSLMENGTIDFMAGLLKSPEREKYIYFVCPPYKKRSDTVFFVQTGKRSMIKTYDDLDSLRIGTIIGSKYFKRFDNDPGLEKESVANGSSGFNKLLLNRLDTVAFPEAYGIDMIHRMKISDKIEMADFRFAKKKYVYIGISKKSPLMNQLPRVESVIKKMINTGVIKEIIVDYYTKQNLPIPEI